jgi:WD40 repeat protein
MAADPKQAHLAGEFAGEAPMMTCRFDPAGRYIFASSENRLIYRWELAGGKKATLAGHDSWIFDLVVTPDGKTLISAGGDDHLIWWPTEGDAPTPIRKVKAHEGWIRSLALSPDGTLFASGGNDRIVRLWNVADGERVREFTGAERDIYSVMFHPNSQWLLAGDLDGKIRQWNVADGTLVRTFDAAALHVYEGGQQVHYGGIRGLVMSPDTKWLVGGGLHKGSNPLGNVQEPLALRFEWESAKMVRQHLTDGNPNERIWGMHYHAQGFLLAVIGGGKGALIFWNEAEEKPFHTFPLPNTARGMAVHTDGIQIATTHFDNKVRLTKLAAKA